MPSIPVEVSEEIAAYWAELADRVSLPVDTWLALCGSWAAALDIPMTRIVLRQPPAANALDGVAWEVGVFPQLKCPPRSTPGEPSMVNKVILVGNLGRDPEVRATTSGKPIANLSLATNHRWKDAGGNRQEQAEWHTVVCFGRLAEVAGQYLSRGRLVYVEGPIQTRSWEDPESGQTRYSTEVICESLQMLDQGHASEAGSASEDVGSDAAADAAQSPGPEPEDGDIPF